MGGIRVVIVAGERGGKTAYYDLSFWYHRKEPSVGPILYRQIKLPIKMPIKMAAKGLYYIIIYIFKYKNADVFSQ